MTITLDGKDTSFVIAEHSKTSSQSGFIDLTVSLMSISQNLSYSRVVNTSSIPEVFPFISGITNQSFSYGSHGISMNAQVSKTGTSPVSFNGTSFNGQAFALVFTITTNTDGKTITSNATLIAFPSGLLYSLTTQQIGSGPSIYALLIATSLPLNEPANSTSTTVGAAMVGAGILAAAAIAVPWKFRRRKNSVGTSKESEEKPTYWVD